HLGAKFVEIQLFHKVRRQGARAIKEKTVAILGRRFGDDEVHDDFALRRKQRGKKWFARCQLRHVVGDEPVKKPPRIVAGDLAHTAMGKKSCLHAKSLGLPRPSLARTRGGTEEPSSRPCHVLEELPGGHVFKNVSRQPLRGFLSMRRGWLIA